MITKHDGTGGAVTVDTVKAQLLYEIGGPRYLGPDVTSRFDTIALTQHGHGPGRHQRRQGRGAAGHPQGLRQHPRRVPQQHDVRPLWTRHRRQGRAGAAAAGGRRSAPTVWSGHSPAPTTPTPTPRRPPARSSTSRSRTPDPKRAKAFSRAAVELALASYPGFTLTSPPGDGTPVGVYRPEYVPQEAVEHVAVLPDGTRTRRSRRRPRDRRHRRRRRSRTRAPVAGGPTRQRCRSARIVGARSGDKGGDANLGVWVRDPAAYPWLAAELTVDRLRELLPEAKDLDIERHPLPNLTAINFVLHGLLGQGVAASTRFDPQAKSLGEWLRSRARRHPGGVAVSDPFAHARTRRPCARPPGASSRRRSRPHLDDWERAGELPRDLHRKAGELGLLGVAFPESVGRRWRRRHRRHDRHRGDPLRRRLRRSRRLPVHLRHRAAAHRRPRATPAQIDRWVRPTLAGEKIGSLAVTEPDGGSDVANVRTTAKRDGDHYIVNGAKTFITSGCRADFVTTVVRTGDAGAHGLSLLVVEQGTPGFTVTRKLDKMGWHCSDTAELSYVDVRVPATNLVGAEGTGFAQVATHFVTERLALAVQGYATAQRALDLTVEWCRLRETFGRPLISRQVVQHKLAEMARRVDVARTYTRSIAVRHAAGEPVDRRGVLRQEHRRRDRRVGGQRGRPAARRARLHAGVRSGATLPGRPHPRHRRRHQRDPDRTGRESAWDTTHDDTATPLWTRSPPSTRPTATRCWPSSPRSRPSTRRRSRAAARSTSSGTASAASCWPANGSSCCSTRTRRSWSCRRSPRGAATTRSAPAWSPASASSRASSAWSCGSDPTVKGGASNPWTRQEVLPGRGHRRAEPAADDQPRRVRRRRSADAEGDLHPGWPDLPRPHPGVGRRRARRSRWCSATPPRVARTCRACPTTW